MPEGALTPRRPRPVADVRPAEAALAYDAAIARSENATERDFLQRSRQALVRT